MTTTILGKCSQCCYPPFSIDENCGLFIRAHWAISCFNIETTCSPFGYQTWDGRYCYDFIIPSVYGETFIKALYNGNYVEIPIDAEAFVNSDVCAFNNHFGNTSSSLHVYRANTVVLNADETTGTHTAASQPAYSLYALNNYSLASSTFYSLYPSSERETTRVFPASFSFTGYRLISGDPATSAYLHADFTATYTRSGVGQSTNVAIASPTFDVTMDRTTRGLSTQSDVSGTNVIKVGSVTVQNYVR